jgi:hypothetical protein
MSAFERLGRSQDTAGENYEQTRIALPHFVVHEARMRIVETLRLLQHLTTPAFVKSRNQFQRTSL